MNTYIEKSKVWLKQFAFPLWLQTGVDPHSGAFVEAISLQGAALPLPRRAIVQARQIYSFRVGIDLDLCNAALVAPVIEKGAQYLLEHYSLADGSFLHSVDVNGKAVDKKQDLYTQAFVLFGLANAFRISPKLEYKMAAEKLLHYLQKNRRAECLGYTEIINSNIVYASNPHMHLFEAALSWMQIDPNPAWAELAAELAELCQTKFIQKQTGLLAEHFNKTWQPTLEQGRFYFEPGHQYEWTWLLGQFFGKNTSTMELLFQNAERYGVCPQRKIARNEIWSDFSIKLNTARLWPQCERIKAALQLKNASVADEAIAGLFRYFEVKKQGLWYDLMLENAAFQNQEAKASSMYHIVNALHDYIRLRATLS